MPNKALLTLLISIAAHVAAVVALERQETEQKVISVGSIQAPVSLSFSTVSQPKPEPVQEKVVEKPEPKPKPKPEKKPVEQAKPVLKKQEKKPEPEKEKRRDEVRSEVVKKAESKEEPRKKTETAPEPAHEKSVTQVSEMPGLSDDPVMVAEPAIRNWVEPKYPRLAKRRNQEGVVMLDVIIDEQGQPMKINILTSSGYAVLDKAAITAVKRWEFKPETRNNRRVKSRVHIPVAFEIT